jgi:putative transposase
MQQITFAPGKTVLVTGKEYLVTGISDDNVVHLLSRDKIDKKVDLETLHDWYLTGNLRAANQDKSLSKRKNKEETKKVQRNEFHSEEAKERGLVVKAFVDAVNQSDVRLDDKDPTFRQVVDELAEKHGIAPPSARTIYRWKSQSHFTTGMDGFIPRWSRRGGRGVCRLDSQVQELMEEIMTNEYMTSSQKTLGECYDLFSSKIRQLNLMRPQTAQFQIPAKNTFERWIKNSGQAYEIYATRNSKRAADDKYRSSMRNSENWQFMQCVEVDHTPLDIMVTDEDNETVLGRPRLTLMIEWKTRCCIGFTIGFEGTSTQTVLECVKVAVSHKGEVCRKYPSIQNDWPCWGMPQYLKLDNGSEFHSLAFRMSMEEMGIGLIYCPRKKAWFKGRVERALKRFNHELIATLPGATFTQLYNRTTGNDPSKYAVIDVKRLKEIIHTWVIDDYHQTYQKRIKSTPHQAWKRLFDLTLVPLPGDLDLLEILCTDLKVHTLQHYGIELLEERSFNNSELRELARRKQFDKTIKVKVRYNPQKLDRIWVYDEDQMVWIEVKNANPETRDLSAFQLSMINKLRNAAYKESKSKPSIAAVKGQVRDIVRPLLQSKKQRERRRAHKILGLSAPTSLSLQSLEDQVQDDSVMNLNTVPTSPVVKQKTKGIERAVKANPEPAVDAVKKIAIDAIYEGDIEIFTIEPLKAERGRHVW